MPSTLPLCSTRCSVWVLLVIAAVVVLGAWTWQQRPQPVGSTSTVQPEDDVCLVAPPTPYDPASGIALTAPRPVPQEARCPVCGMFPARALEWAAQIIFQNGDTHFFDSPLSLFMFLQDVERYSPGRSTQDIVAWYVSDSALPPGTGVPWIDARQAFYVHGSNARGPMRAGNLPAFSTQAAAAEFAQRRGGRVLGFTQIDTALVNELGRRSVHTGH